MINQLFALVVSLAIVGGATGLILMAGGVRIWRRY
jgi:hypothetical protein